jgi:hypothetical protein
MTHHQFSLWGYQKPTGKVPISAERIREAKALFQNGDQKMSAAKLREVRESLENYCDRIHGSTRKTTERE